MRNFILAVSSRAITELIPLSACPGYRFQTAVTPLWPSSPCQKRLLIDWTFPDNQRLYHWPASGSGQLYFVRTMTTAKESKDEDKQKLISTDEKTVEATEASADADPTSPVAEPKQLSTGERLKLAVRDYGGTVLVFHITMSLMSLGSCYVLVSSGLDLVGLLAKVGVSESVLESKITQGGSTFVLAYAIHKVFAPVRLGITLTAVPFIVKKLRSIGILKTPS